MENTQPPSPSPPKVANSNFITKTALRRLMKEEANAGMISQDAVNTLAEFLRGRATEITRKALEIAGHSKRKTIMKEDIKLALGTS